MGIVNELQASAEREDVLTALRKAKRVATKLNREDIIDWLTREQDGYPSGATIPEYRKVRVEYAYKTNGYIPAGFGMVKDGIVSMPGLATRDTVYPVLEPIGQVTAWISQLSASKGGIYHQLSGSMARTLRETLQTDWPALLNQLTFLARLDEFQVRDIPEQVKNRVLHWACELERAGITGEEHSFTAAEQRAAQGMTFYINSNHDDRRGANVVDGTVTGSIQQGSANSSQKVTVRGNEFTESMNAVKQAMQTADIEDLDKEEILETLRRIEQLAAKAPTPQVKMKLQEKLAVLVNMSAVVEKVSHAIPYLQHIQSLF